MAAAGLVTAVESDDDIGGCVAVGVRPDGSADGVSR
jgi:hypothetical protein